MLFIRRQLDRLTRPSGPSSLDGRGSCRRHSPRFSLGGRGSVGRQSRHFSLDATLALVVLIPWLLAAAACQRTEHGAAPAPAAAPAAAPPAAPLKTAAAPPP